LATTSHQETAMADHSTTAPLPAFSDHLADLVAGVAPSVVAVHGRGRAASSGFVWRPGRIVTADEALEADGPLAVTLPDRRRVEAILLGRDPATDVALLKIDDAEAPALPLDAADPRPGHLVLAVGRREGEPAAHFGSVQVAGGPWRSQRGGQIDRLLRLDLRLEPRSEGGVVLDARGRAIGMAVHGPRRTVLAIPAATIERVADQLSRSGRIARGYAGLGLQPVRLDEATARSLDLPESRGLIVVDVDPDGPGRRAGVLQGDIVAKWDGEPVRGMRELSARLGPESVGRTVAITVIRAGQPTTLDLAVAERPAP
jgi:S1-C subfamily serine protease